MCFQWRIKWTSWRLNFNSRNNWCSCLLCPVHVVFGQIHVWVDSELGGGRRPASSKHSSTQRALHLQSSLHTPPGRSSPSLLRQCTPAMAKRLIFSFVLKRLDLLSVQSDLLADKLGVFGQSFSEKAQSFLMFLVKYIVHDLAKLWFQFHVNQNWILFFIFSNSEIDRVIPIPCQFSFHLFFSVSIYSSSTLLSFSE